MYINIMQILTRKNKTENNFSKNHFFKFVLKEVIFDRFQTLNDFRALYIIHPVLVYRWLIWSLVTGLLLHDACKESPKWFYAFK